MPVRVRPAVPDDFEPVAALLHQLGRPEVLGTPEEADHRRRFAAWLESPELFGLVAEEDGEVVGFIDLQLVRRLNFADPQAWVPDFIVADPARSRGIGSALLREAEALARRHGAFALTLESANWRTRAHAFYAREGMRDAAKAFVKVLQDLGWPPSPDDAG